MRSVSADANLQPCSDCETISGLRHNVASGPPLELPTSNSTSSSLLYKSKNNTHYSVASFELQKKDHTHKPTNSYYFQITVCRRQTRDVEQFQTFQSRCGVFEGKIIRFVHTSVPWCGPVEPLLARCHRDRLGWW